MKGKKKRNNKRKKKKTQTRHMFILYIGFIAGFIIIQYIIHKVL